ncbi:MAG TPA: hypothetical protein VFQ25_05895 [Ktedonobacterales bacterium]|nr:hypothetical protein [Ktedonobacterales bacterium]
MATGRRGASRRRWLIPLVAVLVICSAPCALARLQGWYFQPFPQIIGQNCGRALNNYDPDQAALCLWRAYTACRAATLVYISQGVDSRSTSAITVQPKAGGCAVTDVIQGANRIFPTNIVPAPVLTHQCAGMRQQNGGLLLSRCGGKSVDYYLPPRPTEQIGHVCGVIDNQYATPYALASDAVGEQATVTGIEDCFWQAYVSCARPSTLVMNARAMLPRNANADAFATHNLVAQDSPGSCALTDTVVERDAPNTQSRVTYTCASLAHAAGGGLVARACGAEGDLTIPPAPPLST